MTHAVNEALKKLLERSRRLPRRAPPEPDEIEEEADEPTPATEPTATGGSAALRPSESP